MIMTVTAFSMLLVLFFRMSKKYGWAALTHPGLWFSFAWIAAFLAYWAIDAVGGVPVHDDLVLDQLMIMVLITTISFFALTFLPSRRSEITPRRVIKNYPKLSPSPYKVFASIGALGAVVNWAVLGANFGYDDNIRQQWLTKIPPITAMTWHLYILSFPAAIFAGRLFFTEILQGKPVFRRKTIYWAIPAIAGIIWSLGTGGRQAFGIMLFYFVVGATFSLGWATNAGHRISLRVAFRLFTPALLSVLLFAFFVGLTGLSRAKQQGAEASSFDDIWYLAPVGQLISYTGLTLATHQAYGEPRSRDLSETGPVSLAGFQYFGLRLITGWRPLTVDDTNPERALAASGFALASGTRNVFYDFQEDFGYYGAMGISVTLALISHILFLRSGFLNKKSLLRSAPLVMAIMFWGYSHQFSLLMFDTFFWLVVSCALWDLAGEGLKRSGMFAGRRKIEF